MPLFLASAHPPAALARGLHAGLKSRGGQPTPLPVRLKGEIYVNAGFIDGLSAPLIRALNLADVHLRIVARGSVSVGWYYLNLHGSIHHLTDQQSSEAGDLAIPTIQDLPVPPVLYNDDNVALIFFRVQHDNNSPSEVASAELIDWCFHAKTIKTEIKTPQPLLLLSRTLGESSKLIEQHLAHQLHLADLQQQHQDLQFMPMPRLQVYESDYNEFQRSIRRLEGFTTSHTNLPAAIALHYNRFNLGGGGNMCYAAKQAITDCGHVGDFVMLDSDTIVPFKTLYTTALISAISTEMQEPPAVYAPVIAFRKQPTSVLEAGALFGRGSWQLAEPKPYQPCIYPLHHRADLSDKHVQARISQAQESEYPPFIYSLYRLPLQDDPSSFLPAPFFLRGDDVEYGLRLNRLGVKTNILSTLIVFQDPKHSPWHEIMAILHSTVILLAYTPPQDIDQLSDHLSDFFNSRLQAHASLNDLHGIAIYQEVLTRLLSLLPLPTDRLLAHFYNPDYYLKLRKVNESYTHLNYNMAKGIGETMPPHSYREHPFLYYPIQPEDQPQPKVVLLMNHLSETAAVHNPGRVAYLELQAARRRFKMNLSSLFASIQPLKEYCEILLDRSRIYEHYQSCYEACTGNSETNFSS